MWKGADDDREAQRRPVGASGPQQRLDRVRAPIHEVGKDLRARSAELGTATRSANPPARFTPMIAPPTADVPQPALAQVALAAGQDRG